MRRSTGTPPIIWALVVALALVAWVPFTWFYFRTANQTMEVETKPRKRAVRVSLRRRQAKPPKKKPAPKLEPIRNDMQVVDNTPPEVEKRPEKPRFLSNVDRTVKKETKARANDNQPAGRQAPQVKKSKKQSPQSRSLKETTLAKAAKPSPEMPQKTVKAPKANEGQQRPRTQMARNNNTRALVPSIDKRSAVSNLQALTGSSGTVDALQDVDEGKETVLNSRRFQHWDFFNTVKQRVRRHWRPAQAHRRNDPTGKVYGTKDRLTVLKVTLDRDGKLQRLTTVKDSGVSFLDDEARRAFNKAAPFRNPPEGLIDEQGLIVFKFGFLFEIGTSRYKFFRMPM